MEGTDEVTERTQWILYLCIAIFAVVLATLGLLLWRGGRSRETADTMRAIREVGDQVEGMRSQNTNEHAPMQDYIEWTYGQVRRILARLGFLDDKAIPEPPIPPTVKPSKDDIA